MSAIQSAFAAAALARGLCWCFADLMLGFHLHARLGLSAADTGTLLFSFLALGAAADFCVGYALQRTGGHRRATLVAQRFGAVLSAVAFTLLFSPIAGFYWTLIWGTTFRLAFSIYAVPQASLMTLMAESEREQRGFVVLQTSFSALARLISGLFVFLLATWTEKVASNLATAVAGSLGLCAITTAIILERICSRTAGPPIAPDRQGSWQFYLPPGLGWLLLSIFVHASGMFMVSRLLLFTPSETGEPMSAGPWLMLLFACGMTAGPIVGALSRGRIAFAIAIAFTTLMAVVIVLPVVPLDLRLAVAFLYGAALGGSGMLLWQAIATVVRSEAARTGRRCDSITFGLVAFVTKLGIAIGSGGLAFVLDGYESGEGDTAAVLCLATFASAAVCTFAFYRAQPASLTPHAPLRSSARKAAGKLPRRLILQQANPLESPVANIPDLHFGDSR